MDVVEAKEELVEEVTNVVGREVLGGHYELVEVRVDVLEDKVEVIEIRLGSRRDHVDQSVASGGRKRSERGNGC